MSSLILKANFVSIKDYHKFDLICLCFIVDKLLQEMNLHFLLVARKKMTAVINVLYLNNYFSPLSFFKFCIINMSNLKFSDANLHLYFKRMFNLVRKCNNLTHYFYLKT